MTGDTSTTEMSFPAKYICHWPTGPHPCCEEHADQLRGLAGILGTYVAFTPASEGSTCVNCENEAEQSDD